MRLALVYIYHLNSHRDGHMLDHIYANKFQIELKYRVVNGSFNVTTDHYPIIIDLPSVEHQSMKETTHFRSTKISTSTVSNPIFIKYFKKWMS